MSYTEYTGPMGNYIKTYTLVTTKDAFDIWLLTKKGPLFLDEDEKTEIVFTGNLADCYAYMKFVKLGMI